MAIWTSTAEAAAWYDEQARTFEGAAQASGEGDLADAEWVDHDEVIIHEVLVAAAEAGA